ncbi:efflux RND transporter permease subunit [Aeromonas lusitana]|uniref:Transporter n=1 Tax=Aeromonas lusitana TaxID=931529 RepID=A0A2M8H6C3_9GAMM|nr:efflux RND transporter permease subunit [Aeromonas lusitana]PJC92117.1 transporter [Aeromonas lusitana]
MTLSTFAIRQRTFVVFFSVLCTLVGIYSYFDLGKLEDPSFTVKSAVIVTLYPGATAQEVEALVTDPVETKLQEMGSLWKLRSLSRPGSSMIFVDLQEKYGTDVLPQQWDLLRRKVQDVKLTLPPQAQISIVQDEFSEVYGMLFAVHGDDIPMHQLKDQARELQRRLKAVPGVKKVQLHGVKEQVVNIDVSSERLAKSQISMAELIAQLNSQNMPVAAGDYDVGMENLRVAQSGAYRNVEDVRNLMLTTGAGGQRGTLRLGDVADVYLDYQTPTLTESRFNGQQAITLAVSPESGINVVSIGDELSAVLQQFESELPLGASVGTIAYQPGEVTKSINNFVINLIESIVIVVVVLLIFMGWRSATIVGVSLLLNILFTLVYMNLTGVDLQRVSLGSFILALGMLVDNAIVIVDLFVAKVRKGIERSEAVKQAIAEMALPLLGATVVACLGATPVLLSQTDSAEFSISIVQVLCSSLLLSWVVAMVITPLMCWAFIKAPSGDEDAKPEGKAARLYRRAVHWTVDNPKRAMLIVLPLLLLTGLAAPLLSVNFMPSSDRSIVFLDYWLPNGGRIERTSADMKQIEQWLLAQPEVASISSFVGESAPRFSVTVEPEPQDQSYGQILINARAFDEIPALVARGDAWLASRFPYAEPRFRALKLATKDKFSIEARFEGPDPAVLHHLSQQAQAIISANPHTKYVRDDWRQQSKLVTPVINQTAARLAGVSNTDIAMAIHSATEGLQIGTLRQQDDLIPIKLRSANSSLETLADLPVRSVLGQHSVPLGQVLDEIKIGGEESMIWRRNRLPAITVQADVSGDTTAATVRKQLAPALEAIALPAGYQMHWGGEYYDEKRAIDDLMLQTPKAAVMMFIVLMALFNAYRQPLIIFITLPLAAIGIIWSLLLADKPFGFMAIVGMICLSGMIIKNGIVLLDQVELERRSGRSLGDAVKEATLNRTMAISMAALTTVLGMVPLLTDRLFDQMAATIIGGLMAASVLSLFVMPALYMIFFAREGRAQSSQAAQPSHQEPSHE